MKTRLTIVLFVLLFLCSVPLLASTGNDGHETSHGLGASILWIAILVIVGKCAGLVERWGQAAVLGELVAGVLLGNLNLIGIHVFDPIKIDPNIIFFSGFGVIILLFGVGLESNVRQMMRVGIPALRVATVGVVVPFVLGWWVVGPWVLPGLSSNTYMFIGATLTATSVGITARVFKDLNKLHTPEAQIVLGAAVFDDVMGLIILAVVSAIITTGAVSVLGVSWILGKALLFLIGAIVIGQIIAPFLGKFFSWIHSGMGMKLALALGFCLVLAYVAEIIGLAPIVGAFAAGLILDPVHFKHFNGPDIVPELDVIARSSEGDVQNKINTLSKAYANRHIEDLLKPIEQLFVPIFFVFTGMTVRLETFGDTSILWVAFWITTVAFGGKVVSGLVAGKVDKQIVGWGMVPRGEVGLIFATIGRSIGVVSERVFSVIVVMVIVTTLLTPPILTYFLRRRSKHGSDTVPESV